MDIEPVGLIETAREAADQKERRTARLNAVVAITVAVLATFMGICKVKDDNIVQVMQQVQAEQDPQSYDALNYRDDQFDLSDALIAVAIAMLAVTALTRLWSLYWVSLRPTAPGIFMGIAGLTGLHIHPEFLVKLLS